MAIERRFQAGERATFDYRQMFVKTHIIPAQASFFSTDTLVAGSELPSRVIILFVRNQAFNGKKVNQPPPPGF